MVGSRNIRRGRGTSPSSYGYKLFKIKIISFIVYFRRNYAISYEVKVTNYRRKLVMMLIKEDTKHSSHMTPMPINDRPTLILKIMRICLGEVKFLLYDFYV